MVVAVAYVLVATAALFGALPVLVRLFGEAPGGTKFQNDYGKKEDNEMLMFSGLETQGEISRLLDELYGGLGQASAAEAGTLSLISRRPRPTRNPSSRRRLTKNLAP